MTPIACSVNREDFRDATVDLNNRKIDLISVSQRYNIPTRKLRNDISDLKAINTVMI